MQCKCSQCQEIPLYLMKATPSSEAKRHIRVGMNGDTLGALLLMSLRSHEYNALPSDGGNGKIVPFSGKIVPRSHVFLSDARRAIAGFLNHNAKLCGCGHYAMRGESQCHACKADYLMQNCKSA